jgi:hypothetical protein
MAAGEMAEWLKAHAWNACVLARVPWVRIPLSPPKRQPFQWLITQIDEEANIRTYIAKTLPYATHVVVTGHMSASVGQA